MSEVGDAFVRKAKESVAGAASEHANRRYNNVANRCYYACFQAAIGTLVKAGIRPTGGGETWSHAMVQSQFAGVLIGRRKMYPTSMRDTLQQLSLLRNQGDYNDTDVSQTQALRALGRCRTFVATIDTKEGATT